MMGVQFQEILIRCTFIFEDVPQSPFVDFLDFRSVSFSAEVPDLVTIVEIRQYKYAIKRFLGSKWQKVFESVQSTLSVHLLCDKYLKCDRQILTRHQGQPPEDKSFLWF